MSMGPNPIPADATYRALTPEQAKAAGRNELDFERAVYDEEEIRELEHAELYGGSAAGDGPDAVSTGATDPGVRALRDGPLKRFLRTLFGHR